HRLLHLHTFPTRRSSDLYYLAVTNLSAIPAPIAVTVLFDITPLTNCVPNTNFVGPAGIPRYFQFDVPTNGAGSDLPQEATFWVRSEEHMSELQSLRHLVC